MVGAGLLAGPWQVLGAAEGPQFTNCIQVLELTPEQAALSKPAKVQGVVTCYIPTSSLCFVQDESAGIYVQARPWPRDLAFGDKVEVNGVTAAGLFSPIIDLAEIKRVGRGKPPPANKISIEELRSGRNDSQWVELSGVVQVQEKYPDHWYLQMWTGGNPAEVLIFSTAELPDFVDTLVRVDGVGGTFYDKNQLTGFGLFVTGLEQVHLEKPAVQPFSRTIRKANKPIWYSPDGSLDHRIHLKGIVSSIRSSNLIFLEDETGGFPVELSGKPALKEGDEIEVAGFLRDAATNPKLVRAILKVIGHRDRPLSPNVSLKQLGSREYQSRSVAVSGVVIKVSPGESGGSRVLMEESDDTIVVNSVKPVPASLRGAQVRVEGVWTGVGGNGPELLLAPGAEFTVLSRNAANLTALTETRRIRGLAIAGLAAALFSGFWALGMKQRARKVSQENGNLKKQLAETRFEAQQMSESRERLGRDLHDHIIQSIYAVGLNMEDCRELVQKEPDKVASRLKTATIDINTVIRELRNVVTGLEGSTIQPKELRTALKSLAMTMGQEHSNRIRVELEAEGTESLTAGQATEMLYIAREAMSNSVRHGSATTTTISLRLINGVVRFCIEDNGKGFNVEARDKHGFGLRNMAKRAENLSATFQIESEEGKGTRIKLDIPMHKPHFFDK